MRSPTVPALVALAFVAALLAFALAVSVPVSEASASTSNATTTVSNAATAAPASTGTTAKPNTTNATADAPTIVSVYPNPAARNDAGEFVVVRVPPETNVSGWHLDDGESTADLPNATVSGRVALSTDPETARNRTNVRVLPLSGHLSLANGGETVRLASDDRTVSVSYDDAPEGERWHRTGDGWAWEPLGATDFEVGRAGPANATAFVLPDSPEIPVETLRSADRRLLLAGYTFASERAVAAAKAAARRGVEVRVLVDGGPVGGMPRRQADALDSLADAGIEVRVVDGPLARYDFHHPKYAVADDRALVLTENWKPAGTGGKGSRGWGVVVESPGTADHLAKVFAADAGWRDAIPWSEFREDAEFEDSNPANGSFPSDISPASVEVDSTEVLVAPDNAESELVGLLDSANDSVRIQQAGIGSPSQPFLRAAIRAAERGVEVRILLSGVWYAEEENRALADRVNDRAESRDLPVEARLADPHGRYEKVHAKGVVVDGEAAVVGSLNWNNNSARDNREVAVVLRGAEVAGFYAGAFDADWSASGEGGANRVPVGLLVAVAIGALAAILLARTEVTFENE
ncbi:phospholipase D-like domain-containing protein [Halorussus amylolyticus]|uniref:phospholipase D-like domain-containing protein n=1 Tax=Halorussus amylolyticus TaxID=1126242 RepID=UPI001045A882|nr:phospholipase D-like domain-containing protein [Halorussus amylolyticus]